MPLDGNTAFATFIGLALIVLTATLLGAGRRTPPGILLALFLTLVGINFLSSGAQQLTADPRWARVGLVALALDPFFLLCFVTTYPYPRRSALVRAVIAGEALIALACVGLAVGAEDVLASRSLSRLALALNLAWVYAAAWVLSLKAAVEAPTPMLGERAAWLMGAVGVAVVPRLGLVPDDFGLRQALATEALAVATGLAVMAAFFLGGTRIAQPARRPQLRAPLLLVGIAVCLVAAARLAPFVFAGPSSLGPAYGLRWLVFGGILVYGLLAHELVEFRRASEHLLPWVGGIITATAALLFVLVVSADAPASQALPLAFAAALASVMAGWWGTRVLVRWVRSLGGGAREADRRLTLYQAALEAAWSQGPPGPERRRQLEADRRAFGVSYEEAKALEHGVAGRASARGATLDTGDEAAPGLVIDRLLGEGAHGQVFLANQLSTGRRVVVKEIRMGAGEDALARRHFLAETKALRALDHPNIVRLREVHVADGRFLLVMDYVEAQPLSKRLESGSFTRQKAKALARDVLDALETAHAHGFLHRDLKPSNILIAAEGRALLTDFGLATESKAPVEATVSNLDALGALEGTLAYMAPEQARGGPPGVSTDLYSVGLVLFEVLSGRPAIEVRGKTIYAAIEAVANPRIDLEAVPGAWRPLLAKALSPEPSSRYQSAAAMRQAIQRVL